MLAADELQRYVQNQLHAPLRLAEWSRQAALPAFLRTQYKFFEGRLLGARVLFAVSLSESSVRKMNVHRQTIERYSSLQVVFVLDRITPGMRRSLIAAKIPFVVPGTQLYLPFLGLSLQERFRSRALEERRLSPSAQAALLYALLYPDPAKSTPTEMAGVLGYTSMAMVRAFDQLEAAALINTARVDRQRIFTLTGPRLEVWDRAQLLLASPVAKRIWVLAETDTLREVGQVSGITGLAHYSSLAPTRIPVRAVAASELAQLNAQHAFTPSEASDDADLEIEVWRYSPRLLSNGDVVDRLSLYLDLREDEDERVQSALDEMMRGVEW